MAVYTLPKSERLYLRSSIGQLFAEGKGFMAFPYRVVWRAPAGPCLHHDRCSQEEIPSRGGPQS